MAAANAGGLAKSDILLGGVRRRAMPVHAALREVASFARLEAATTSYVMLPRTRARILVMVAPDGSTEAIALGPGTRLVRKPAHDRRVFAIELHPAAARAALGVPLAHCANTGVPLVELWGTRLAGDWAAELERALRARCAGATDPRASAVACAARGIDADPGRRIGAVARELGVSARQLGRWFAEFVGVSPKRYAMVERVRRALAIAGEGDEPAWAAVAAAAGFYDQSQMINDFRQMTGQTPRQTWQELRAIRAV
jgi:AraC-like DNA-binding protein